jgi:hypothetical protein
VRANTWAEQGRAIKTIAAQRYVHHPRCIIERGTVTSTATFRIDSLPEIGDTGFPTGADGHIGNTGQLVKMGCGHFR